MILSIEKDGRDIIQGNTIQHVLVEEFIYGVPLIFRIGVKETTLEEENLIQGGAYRLITMFGTALDVVLSEIEPFSIFTGGDTSVTDYIFMEETSYKLKHSLFPPTASAWGVNLKRHIIGKNNQLSVALIELRKMGLFLALSKNLAIIQKQVLEYQSEDAGYIKHITKIKLEKTSPTYNNYAMLTNGETATTQQGAGNGVHIPMMKQEHINAFNLKIIPKYVVISHDANLDILLGSAVFFKQKKYCVMEKQTYFSKDRASSVITLGCVPEEE